MSATEKVTTTKIKEVSKEEFREFIEATGYTTTAEIRGWSYYIDQYRRVSRQVLNWKNSCLDCPVVHVSYSDAKAYCEWAKVEMLSVDEYYEIEDNRSLNISGVSVLPIGNSSIIGNAWDLLKSENEVMIAGGSFACHDEICRGFNPRSSMFIQEIETKTTANYIGFVVKK